MDEVNAIIQQKPLLFCCILLLLLLVPSIHQKSKAWRLALWRKSLNLDEHQAVFQELYQDTDGYALSSQERQRVPDAIEYTYGEIEFLPFIALLSLVKPDAQTVFYDLGSGTGKAVLACAMVYPVHAAVGVELFPALYQRACDQRNTLAIMPDYAERIKNTRFIHGNFLEVIAEDATLIFINSTTILGDTWERLSAHIESLPSLKTVITTTKPLCSLQFLPSMSTRIQMSWGVVLAYIHSRT